MVGCSYTNNTFIFTAHILLVGTVFNVVFLAWTQARTHAHTLARTHTHAYHPTHREVTCSLHTHRI